MTTVFINSGIYGSPVHCQEKNLKGPKRSLLL